MPEPISVERAVEDGALIARSALAISTRNHIIVAAVRDDRAFDADEIRQFVRAEFLGLATEQDAYAKRMHEAVASAGSGEEESSSATLTRRGVIYSALSEELARLAADDEVVAGVAETARIAAWDELSRTIETRLDRMSEVEADADYDSKRNQRMKDLRKFDLVPLIRDH
ncbi:MAG TPA: hypothetical protein VIJ76_05650 [Galbitalea sp.]